MRRAGVIGFLCLAVAGAAVLLSGFPSGLAGEGRAAPPARSAGPAVPSAGTSPAASPRATARALGRSRPVSLEIPRIGVRTSLLALGKNPDGTLEVPSLSQVHEAGWYRLGPAPGSTGPAVIAGHVDSTTGPAVFYRLGELEPGDTVRIARQDGTRVIFHVDSLERVPKDRFPTQRVYGEIGFPGLRLITCGGDFDAAGGHYRDNVIVYAHLAAVEQTPRTHPG